VTEAGRAVDATGSHVEVTTNGAALPDRKRADQAHADRTHADRTHADRTPADGALPDGGAAAGAASLADVMPAAAVALGVPPWAGDPAVTLPPARVVVVLLVDGLGDVLLADRGGHAPFLRSLRTGPALASGFPSTTATSMGMLGTGLPPGGHGLVGLEVLDPARGVVFNELAWDPAVDPRAWQPQATVFERVEAAGHDVVRIGPHYFDGSGLTEATFRGGRFAAADTLARRVETAIAAARSVPAGRGGLVYVYWGDLDKAGHVHGCDSWEWTQELESVDAFARRLAEGLPRDALLVVTADHGMVDVPFADRLDLATETDLAAGVRLVGGEARALHLYCRRGAARDVIDTWRARVGDRMAVLPRDEAVARGWFGPVAPHVLPRIGDVVTAATGRFAVVDSRTTRPEVLALLGLHGAATDEERLVPLLVTPGLG
jgi:hypothetical protein